MSESRSEFEAWALSGNMSIGTLRHIGYAEGSYSDSRTHAAWLGWQAGRRAALESAEKACEAVADGHHEVASVSDPQAGAFYGSLVSPGHDPYNFKPYDQAVLPDGAIPFCAPYNGRKEG